MRIVVAGGTGVLGCAAVRSLDAAGHDVAVLVRGLRGRRVAATLGVTALQADVLVPETLDRAFAGADVVVDLTGGMPVGHSLAVARAWRRHDELRVRGTRHVVEAAHSAGVRRLVRDSASYLYADQGDDWVTEQSPLEITAATEPIAVAESLVQEFADDSHCGVVLRLGQLVGDDPGTRHELRAVAAGRRVGHGHPSDWEHVLHTDDVGPLVLAALHAPSGLYNVGAEPVQRHDLVQGLAAAVGADTAHLRGTPGRWRGAVRLEPLARSLRVCSEHFASQTGWRPLRPKFDATWLDGVLRPLTVAR